MLFQKADMSWKHRWRLGGAALSAVMIGVIPVAHAGFSAQTVTSMTVRTAVACERDGQPYDPWSAHLSSLDVAMRIL